MTTTHSPLPWRVAACPRGDDERCVMSGGYYVATCHEGPGDLDDAGNDQYAPDANAEHIVRCVNAHDALLAALKTVQDVTRFFADDRVEIPADEWGDVIEAVNAAIALAEGR